ncbi:MAG: T9SS type A sorting domain-containing protein, partial [Bacteroidales bacterium]|nr:T9SS type A sorting domain-containing protein [Bacteroidales bacterium]
DSAVTLHLTIHNAVTHQFAETACDSYTWNGQTYTQSGDYTQHFQTVHGCDSAVTLHLTIHNAATRQFSITACDSYTWNGQTYTQSGDYVQNLTTVHGCDSTVTLHLTIHNTATSQFSETACDSYTWNGQTYHQSGNYVQHFTTVNGCDSTVTLHLTLLPNPTVTVTGNASFCEGTSSQLTATGGGTYQWNTGSTQPVITVSQPGTYTVTATNAEGCSATASVVVTVNPTPQISISGNTTICAGGSTTLTATGASSYIWSTGDQSASLFVNAFGMYSVTGTSSEGCVGSADVVVLVAQLPTITIAGDTNICLGESTLLVAQGGVAYIWSDGSTDSTMLVSTAGSFQVMGFSEAGCHNMATATVHVWNPDVTEETVSVSDSCYIWNGETYCQSGDYVQTLQNMHGCDSTVTLHLTVSVGIDSYGNDYSIRAYPNPTNGIVILEIDNPTIELTEAALYNATGQLVRTHRWDSSGHQYQIDMSDLSSGIYFVRLHSLGHHIGFIKVMKQ